MHHDDSADLVLLSRPVQRRRGRVLDAGRRPGDSRKFPPAAQRPGSHWRGKWQKECSACAEKRGKRGKAHRLRPAGVHPAGSPVTPVAKPLPRHSGSSDDLFGRCVGGRKRMPVQRGNMGARRRGLAPESPERVARPVGGGSRGTSGVPQGRIPDGSHAITEWGGRVKASKKFAASAGQAVGLLAGNRGCRHLIRLCTRRDIPRHAPVAFA